mgnify:CR=1 FL=1
MRFQDRSPGKMELVHDILQMWSDRRLRSNLDRHYAQAFCPYEYYNCNTRVPTGAS